MTPAGVLRCASVGCVTEYGLAVFLRTADSYAAHGYANIFAPPPDLGAHAYGSACRPNRMFFLVPQAGSFTSAASLLQQSCAAWCRSGSTLEAPSTALTSMTSPFLS